MPKPIKKKAVKKTTHDVEGKGVLSKLKTSAGERKRLLAAVTIAVVIIIAGAGGFLIYNSSTKSSAEKLGYEAYKLYYGLYQKQPISREEQYKKAADLFKKAYDTKKSPSSIFYLANCYYELGRFDDALNALGELNRQFPDDERFVPLSYQKKAMINLKKGNKEEALKSLEVLYNYKTGTYKDLALIESGKILEESGRPEEAKKKYEELAKSFPQSPFTEEAKARMGEKKS